jgi:sensor histidine kinase YesM
MHPQKPAFRTDWFIFTKTGLMPLSDRKLRIYGQLSFAIIYFVFFLAQIFIKPQHDTATLLLKSLGATILYIVLLWEPVRFINMWTYKRWGGGKSILKRKFILASLLVPYSFALGIGGQLLENILIWQMPVKKINPAFFLGSTGLGLVFILAETALYESYFMINKWHNSAMETKELKKANLQLQFDALKVQIQPHFLFNTLNTLIGLMKVDTPRAIDFTEKMARVYRYLLEANDRQLISLDEEMKFTRAYFYLLKTRYSEGLHLEASDEDNMWEYDLPPLCLQILIENAVKHNIITRDRPLHIRIDFLPHLNELTVSNNLQRKPQSFYSGQGLAHLRKKFELLHLPGIRIREENNMFSVTVPLLKSNAYASSNN